MRTVFFSGVGILCIWNLYVFYLQAVPISYFYFASNDFTVTFIGTMLKAHKATDMSIDIFISEFNSILFACQVRIHSFKEIRVVPG